MIRVLIHRRAWPLALAAFCCWSLAAAPAVVAPPPAVDQAELTFRAGAYDKALPLWQQKLSAAADAEAAGKALYHIGQCLTATQRYAQAVAAFENLATQFPTSSWADRALLRQGSVECGVLKKPAAGILTWQNLIKKYPRSELLPEAQFLTGMIHWIHGRKSNARDIWRTLMHDHPAHTRASQVGLYMKN